MEWAGFKCYNDYMKKIAIFVGSSLLGIGLLIWVLRIVGWEAIKEALLVFYGPGGLAILVLSFAIILCGAWRWQNILQSRGHFIPLKELWRLYLAYFSLSFFTSMLLISGEVFRVYFVSEKYDIPWPKAATAAIIEHMLELTWHLVVIVVGVGFFLSTIGLHPRNIAFIFGGVFIFFAAITIFFYFCSFRRESIVKIFMGRLNRKSNVVEIEREVFSFFRPRNLVMWQGFAITAVKGAFDLARIWLLIFFLGKGIGFMPVMTILGFFYIALLFPIPAALGAHDGLQAFSFGALGLGQGAGASLAMILRAADLLLALAGLVILFRLGLDLFKLALFKKTDRMFKGVNIENAN